MEKNVLYMAPNGDVLWGGAKGMKVGTVIGGTVFNIRGDRVGRLGEKRAGFENGGWCDREGDKILCGPLFDVDAVFGK